MLEVGMIAGPGAKWARDELVLALDVYLAAAGEELKETDPRVGQLAAVLNSLPLDGRAERTARETALILGDYLRYDPRFARMPARIGELAERVWDTFAGEPERLRLTAESIRANADVAPMRGGDLEEELEFEEGRILTRVHLERERNATLAATKKRLVATQKGRLECDACGFDFREVYGDIGEGFAECHHTAPVATLQPGTNTRLTDLCILCSNCHRMMHRLMCRNSTYTTPGHLRRHMAG